MDDGSSLSQSEVHLQIYNEITAADMQDIQDWVTDNLLPVLRFWGFDIPEGYYMSIADKALSDQRKKILIDDILMRNGYNIKPEYIEEFYGTPLDESEPRSQNPTPQLSLEAGKDKTNLLDFFP
jgi:hypothetical protein